MIVILNDVKLEFIDEKDIVVTFLYIAGKQYCTVIKEKQLVDLFKDPKEYCAVSTNNTYSISPDPLTDVKFSIVKTINSEYKVIIEINNYTVSIMDGGEILDKKEISIFYLNYTFERNYDTNIEMIEKIERNNIKILEELKILEYSHRRLSELLQQQQSDIVHMKIKLENKL